MSSSGTTSNSNDNRNILRCKSEAIKLRQLLETLKNKITEHSNSPFTKTTGKLQTGLTYHHKFNTDAFRFITTGFMERVMQNFLPISQYCLCTAKSLESIGREKKAVP